MRRTKEVSGAVLALLLVLALVDRWTGWPQDVLGWAAGHLRDLIPDSVE